MPQTRTPFGESARRAAPPAASGGEAAGGGPAVAGKKKRESSLEVGTPGITTRQPTTHNPSSRQLLTDVFIIHFQSGSWRSLLLKATPQRNHQPRVRTTMAGRYPSGPLPVTDIVGIDPALAQAQPGNAPPPDFKRCD